MKKTSFLSLSFIVLITLFTGCKDGIFGCMEEQNTGGDFNIFLLKFDTDKELSDKVVMLSWDSCDRCGAERPNPKQYEINGYSPLLHDGYFFDIGGWYFADYYLLSLTRDELQKHEDGWLDDNWRNLVVEKLALSEVYISNRISRCMYEDNYYKNMPYFVRGEGFKVGEDCLYYSEFMPHYYLSRDKINAMIDDGSISLCFKEYQGETF